MFFKRPRRILVAQVLGPSYPINVDCRPYTLGPYNYSTTPVSPIIGKRLSDGKLQLLLTSKDSNRSEVGYYLVYTGTDPTQTTFDTVDEVNKFLNTDFIASPPSKSYDNHRSTDVTTVYSNLQNATFSLSLYTKK